MSCAASALSASVSNGLRGGSRGRGKGLSRRMQGDVENGQFLAPAPKIASTCGRYALDPPTDMLGSVAFGQIGNAILPPMPCWLSGEIRGAHAMPYQAALSRLGSADCSSSSQMSSVALSGHAKFKSPSKNTSVTSATRVARL